MLKRISDVVLNNFPLFIVGYFLLQVLVRLITTGTAVIDESEQVMLSQYLAMGYNAQPPLYTWLQIIVFQIFGENIFAISLLKNGTLLAIYLFTYSTCLLITKSKEKAALSGFGLFFLPQIIWEAQVDQIHTVLLTATAAALFYAFFYTVENKNLKGFLLLGVVCGCGVLAKYNFVVVIGALFVATLCIREYRQIILCKQLLLSILAAALLALPHFIWFFSHLELATTETVDRMSMEKQGSYLADVLHGSGELIVSYIAFTVVFLLVFFLFFGRKAKFQGSNAAKVLLLYIGITFLSVFLAILVIQSTNIKERWLQPFLFVTPMLMFLMADLKDVPRTRIQPFITIGLACCLTVLLVIPLRVIFVDFRSKPHKENYPFTALTEEITKAGFSKGLILAEDKFVGGNLKLRFQDSTVITPSIPLQPFRPAEQTLIVWQTTDPRPYLRSMMLGKSSGIRQITVPYIHSEKFQCTYFIELFTNTP